MKTTNKSTNERHYFIDWLRILLILSVFLFHIGMIFNPWNWHIKNADQYEGLEPIMEFLHYWRMPLLFLISGLGTYYAMRHRNIWQYIKERYQRLFIPFAAGIFLLVPIQVYFERIGQYASLLSFYPHMFDGIYPSGNFSWHHLWFIVYLFLISLLAAPLTQLISKRKGRGTPAAVATIFSKPFAANLFLIPLIASQYLLRPYYPNTDQNLVDDWASFVYYLLFFLSGMLLLSNSKIIESLRRFRYLYLIQTSLATFVMFMTPSWFEFGNAAINPWQLFSYVVAWSAAMAAIGFARHSLNHDHKIRKYANEAIYPFYLLHQPVIIAIGYYVIQWDIHTLWKALIVTSLSFITCISIYWFLIRPFNFLRIIFGMKKRKIREATEVRQVSATPLLLPIEKNA